MVYAAAGLGFVGTLLLLCGVLMILLTRDDHRRVSVRVAGWGVLCLMDAAVCLLLSSAGL
jgi:hypothetical protein